MISAENNNINKYEQKFKGTKVKFMDILKKIDLKLLTNKLVIDGQKVMLPMDEKLDYRIKYEIDDRYSLTIKVTWEGDLKKTERNESNYDLLGG